MKPATTHKSKPTIRFVATFVPARSGQQSDAVILLLPPKAPAALGTGGNIMVEGAINSFPFRAALEPDGNGSHFLRVDKTMRHAAGSDDLETVTVDITPLARRDWIFSITSAKQPETRQRRIEKACDMLASGKRRLCCFPGVKWMMRDNEKSCGMWQPLPNSKS